MIRMQVYFLAAIDFLHGPHNAGRVHQNGGGWLHCPCLRELSAGSKYQIFQLTRTLRISTRCCSSNSLGIGDTQISSLHQWCETTWTNQLGTACASPVASNQETHVLTFKIHLPHPLLTMLAGSIKIESIAIYSWICHGSLLIWIKSTGGKSIRSSPRITRCWCSSNPLRIGETQFLSLLHWWWCKTTTWTNWAQLVLRLLQDLSNASKRGTHILTFKIDFLHAPPPFPHNAGRVGQNGVSCIVLVTQRAFSRLNFER